MSYNLTGWALKKRSDMTEGAAYLCLVEDVPSEDFARIARRKVMAAFEATWGSSENWTFEWEIDARHVSLNVPWSQVETVIPVATKLLRDMGMIPFDPQHTAPTKDDEAYVAALRDAADRETAVDDAQLEIWRRQAESGDPSAMNELGNCYSSGEGTAPDPVQAAVWYRKAADAGHIPAELNLIQCILDGDGVPKDPAEARARYERLVAREPCVSAFELGSMYAKGIGGPVSRERAIEMFTLARKNRHPGAYMELKALGVAPSD